MPSGHAVILVGHGATASDTPRQLVAELKSLEARRLERGERQPSPREAELDRIVRNWPRTRETDPYQFGLEQIAMALRRRIGDTRVVVAYNEFCAPGVSEAVDALVSDGVKHIALISTMFTRGGVHSEREIPEIVSEAKVRHPG